MLGLRTLDETLDHHKWVGSEVGLGSGGRTVVEKSSPLDRRRTTNRKVDRMMKLQDMDISDSLY